MTVVPGRLSRNNASVTTFFPPKDNPTPCPAESKTPTYPTQLCTIHYHQWAICPLAPLTLFTILTLLAGANKLDIGWLILRKKGRTQTVPARVAWLRRKKSESETWPLTAGRPAGNA